MTTPKQTDEIEVTPEMIQAGADVLWGDVIRDAIYLGPSSSRHLAEEVFEAMLAKSKQVKRKVVA